MGQGTDLGDEFLLLEEEDDDLEQIDLLKEATGLSGELVERIVYRRPGRRVQKETGWLDDPEALDDDEL
jgi:hypothetical protein